MKTQFEKKGTQFIVTLEGSKVYIETGGVKAYCSPEKHFKHGWLYSVRDKNFIKALSMNIPNNVVHISHESAEQFDAAQKQAVEDQKQKELEERRESEKGRTHLAIVQYTDDYKFETNISTIVKMNQEEEKMYREEYHGRMHFVSVDSSRRKVGFNLETVQNITKRDSDGFATQGGTVWYLTEQEKAEILSEIEKIEKEKAATVKKQKQEQESERQDKFEEAKNTGKPVELIRYITDCSVPEEECNTDVVVTYAMPDGTTQTKRHHTW